MKQSRMMELAPYLSILSGIVMAIIGYYQTRLYKKMKEDKEQTVKCTEHSSKLYELDKQMSDFKRLDFNELLIRHKKEDNEERDSLLKEIKENINKIMNDILNLRLEKISRMDITDFNTKITALNNKIIKLQTQFEFLLEKKN